MTVSELITKLQQLPQDSAVFIPDLRHKYRSIDISDFEVAYEPVHAVSESFIETKNDSVDIVVIGM